MFRNESVKFSANKLNTGNSEDSVNRCRKIEPDKMIHLWQKNLSRNFLEHQQESYRRPHMWWQRLNMHSSQDGEKVKDIGSRPLLFTMLQGPWGVRGEREGKRERKRGGRERITWANNFSRACHTPSFVIWMQCWNQGSWATLLDFWAMQFLSPLLNYALIE